MSVMLTEELLHTSISIIFYFMKYSEPVFISTDNKFSLLW